MSNFLAASGFDPHPALIVPFVVMLLSIAIAPITLKHHWHRLYPILSVGLGALTVISYLLIPGGIQRIEHTALDYFGFISLIGSLFVIAGGVHIQVKGEAKPWLNSLFLAIGALLANIIGTTGASMLMIRPWIRMNRYRVTRFHIAFFIFIVSNTGGCLTPIGDPPLLLGFLKGVPFFWTLQNLWPAWLMVVGALLAIFFIIDTINYRRAPKEVRRKLTAEDCWQFTGLHNLAFLAVVLAAVFISQPVGLREVLMIGAAIGSYLTTSKKVHQCNDFSFEPIKEVAWLFLGIFATMLPAIDYLQHHAAALGLRSEMQFYWLTGALSGVLDNAPTYLTFLAAAFGLAGLEMNDPSQYQSFLTTHGRYLLAISLGAVFFGAMTYIGNGPNLMVKAIAERADVATPGFFSYLLKFALPILLPIFALVALLFFSRWRVL